MFKKFLSLIFLDLALAHLKHPLLDGHTGVPGEADQLTVQGVEVTNSRGEVGQLHGGEGVKGRGKDNDGEVGRAPWQHQHLLIPVPISQVPQPLLLVVGWVYNTQICHFTTWVATHLPLLLGNLTTVPSFCPSRPASRPRSRSSRPGGHHRPRGRRAGSSLSG